MPAMIVHLVGVERLALAPGILPPAVAKALHEDLEYARLGAALLDLPWYGGAGAELARVAFGHKAPLPEALPLLHRAPLEVGLRFAEVVSRGALVGREAGLAFLTGYFTHLALEEALTPATMRLLELEAPLDADGIHAMRGVEWVQSLLWLRDTLGYDPMGTKEIAQRFRVVKRRGFPVRGLGKGMYLLLATAYGDVLGEAPAKVEVDRWIRGFWTHGRILGSSLGKRFSLPVEVPQASVRLYRSEAIDVAEVIEGALDRARDTVTRLYGLFDASDFSDEAKQRFVGEFAEPGFHL